MSSHIGFLILIPYIIATPYALREFSKSREDAKKRYVAYIFVYSTISFAVILPGASTFLSDLTSIPSISRLIMDISDVFALFYAFMFLREFRTKKTGKFEMLSYSLIIITALTGLFFAANLRSNLPFTVDAVKNDYFFAYALVFEFYYVPVFLYCTIKFWAYARLSELNPSKFRLTFLSFGCLAGFIFGFIKTIHIFIERCSLAAYNFNMMTIGESLSLIVALSLSIGLLWPKSLEKVSASLIAVMSYKRVHFDLLSLLAILNDIRSMLTPYANHDMVRYIRLIGEEMRLDSKELEMIVEASKLCITRLDPDMTIKKDRRTKEGDLSLAFMEEIEFYQAIHEQLKYRRERYDGKGSRDGLVKDELPIGARIIKVVSYYLEETLSQRGADTVISDLRSGAGREFDPKIVEIFINLLEKEGKKV